MGTTYSLSPYLRADDINVAVHDGKATLSGTVGDDISKDLAKEIALGVKGIKDVDNKILVKADYTPKAVNNQERRYGEIIDDVTITAAIKSKLLWSKFTDGLATNVYTKSGKIRLQGSADSATTKALAGRLAMNTKGVVSVDNQLKVAPVKAVVAVKSESNSVSASTAKESAENSVSTVATAPNKETTAANKDAAKPSTMEKAVVETKAGVKEVGTDVSDTWITAKVKSTYVYSSRRFGYCCEHR